MNFKMIIFIIAMVLALQACVSSPVISGLNDELETKVKVSTSSFDSPIVINPHDWFFRGYIDKKTGQRSYQLYVIINSRDWVYWDSSVMKIDGELVTPATRRVGSNVKCSSYGCAHYEDVVVSLTREILEGWITGKPMIRIKSSKVDSKSDIEINPKEVVYFMAQMDSVKVSGP